MDRSDKRTIGMIIHLFVILLYLIWAWVISVVVGHEEWMANYNTPVIIGTAVLITTASIHGIILMIKSSQRWVKK